MCVKHVVSSFLDHSWQLDFVDMDCLQVLPTQGSYNTCFILCNRNYHRKQVTEIIVNQRIEVEDATFYER